MQMNDSGKEKIIMIIALLTVVGMIVFLVYMQKVQQERQQEMENQGQALVEEKIEEQEVQAAEAALMLSSAEGLTFEIYNGGKRAVELDGYEIFLNDESVYTFAEGSVVESEKSVEVTVETKKEVTGSTVVELYTAQGELLLQTIYSLLAQGKETPNFTVPTGFYSSEIEVEIVAPENTKIYYTLDGSIPTENSTLYQEALVFRIESGQAPEFAAMAGITPGSSYVPATIDKCKVLKAVYVDENGNCSDVACASYFLGMDEKIAYRGLPTISITAQTEDLFDYFTGIYVCGRAYEDALAAGSKEEKTANYYQGRNIEAYMEYFEVERGITYSAPVFMSVEDNEYTDYAQKSLRITANGVAAGEGSSLFSYMKGEGSSFLLENGQADYGMKIRNIVSSRLLQQTSITVPNMQACNVFLNGEYWGMYLMNVPIEAATIGDMYDIAEENIIIQGKQRIVETTNQTEVGGVQNVEATATEGTTTEGTAREATVTEGTTVEGTAREATATEATTTEGTTTEQTDEAINLEEIETHRIVVQETPVVENSTVLSNETNELYQQMYQFIITNDMSLAENYETVSEMLDIQNYLEYVCANIYIGNSDWPNTNVYAWRTVNTSEKEFEDGKWRFVWNDAEQALANSDLSSYSLNTYLRPAVSGDMMLYSLMRNTEFRQSFAETMNVMAEEVFTVEKTTEVLDTVSNEQSRAAVASYSRFMGNFSQEAYEQRVEEMKEFFANRKEYIMTYTTEFLSMERVFPLIIEEEVQ